MVSSFFIMKLKIAPSLLSADYRKINMEIKEIEEHADLFHVDVMDGIFVPPKTPFLNLDFVKTIQSSKPLDVHLMVDEPSDELLQGYIDAGASSITIHVEACKKPDHQLDFIKNAGVKTAISLKPKTPLKKITPHLEKVNMVLVMTVEPGWAGQQFMKDMMPKMEELRHMKPALDIQVDGGIDPMTAPVAKKAGANIFVAGSSIFGKKDRIAAITQLRNSLQ